MNYITGKIRWIGKPLDNRFSVSGYSYEGRHHVSRNFKAGTTEFKVGPIVFESSIPIWSA